MKEALYHSFYHRFPRAWLAWKYRVENEYQNYLYAKGELVPFGDTLAKTRALAPVFGPAVKGKSFLEIGCDTGYFPMLAIMSGATRAVGVDRNRHALEKAGRAAARIGLAKVEFRQGCIPAIPVELAADTVLFMSTLHYMFSDKSGNTLLFHDMNSLVSYLAGYVRETLLIEFVSPEDPYARMLVADALVESGVYSERSFVAALRANFPEVNNLGPTHYATRSLYMCANAVGNVVPAMP